MAKPRCLLACTYSPLEAQIKSGGINLTKANYEALAESYDITVMATFKNKQNLLNKMIRLIWACFGYLGGNHFFFERQWVKALQTLNPDLIFIDHSQLGRLTQISKQYLSSHLSQKNKTIIVTNFHNIEPDYLQNSSSFPWPLRSILTWAAIKNEKFAVVHSSFLIALTKEDSHSLFQLYGREADIIIPITLPSISLNNSTLLETKTPHSHPYVLFCGSYFPPNRKAVEWFVHEVLESIPFDLVVVGYQMETLKNLLTHTKLKIIGTVKDLAPYYHYAAAVVNPVQRGAGMNTKSVEAINYGKALVATPQALIGFPKELPSDIYSCPTSNDFIATLRSLNPSTVNTKELKNYFENTFNNNARKKALSKIIF